LGKNAPGNALGFNYGTEPFIGSVGGGGGHGGAVLFSAGANFQ